MDGDGLGAEVSATDVAGDRHRDNSPDFLVSRWLKTPGSFPDSQSALDYRADIHELLLCDQLWYPGTVPSLTRAAVTLPRRRPQHRLAKTLYLSPHRLAKARNLSGKQYLFVLFFIGHYDKGVCRSMRRNFFWLFLYAAFFNFVAAPILSPFCPYFERSPALLLEAWS